MSLKERLTRGFEYALDAASSAAIASYVETGHGELPEGASLLVWSIDSIHDYIFDTGNAAAIRGASLILTNFDERCAQGQKAKRPILPIIPEQILYSGGGGGMAVIPSGDSAEIEAALHRAVTLETRTATCSVASLPLSGGSFHEVKASLYRKLSRYRTLAGTDATVPVQFFEEPCQVCGRRAASRAIDRASLGGRMECSLCSRRIAESKRAVESPDFEEIRAQTGELGVIYLDGNRMGETLTALGSPLDYARFSAALEKGMKRVVDAAIAAYELKDRPTRDRREYGYQLPILGGDDLIMIVPGDIAVPMARDLLAGFENIVDGDEVLRELSKEPLGACAGIAVGRLPIRHLLDEAEAFLESAKTRIYREAGEEGAAPLRSCLDFGVIADGRPRRSSHEAPRLAKKHKEERHQLLFSGKPYSLDELADFTRRHGFFQGQQGVATSQLHACWAKAQDGPGQLRNHLLYQVGRLASWQKLICNLAESREPLSDPDLAFSTLIPSYGGEQVFDIADMLELDGLWREPAREGASS